MHYLKSILTAGGLVVATGPLCFVAAAQGDYIDVEAERAAREAAGVNARPPDDPYGAQPAQAYPATSYGVNSAPAAAPATGAPPPSSPAPAGDAGAGGLGSLFLQVQQLQQEVMRLNGRVEEQAHELRTLREQSLQRYMDLDKRLSEGGGAPGAAAAGAAAGTAGATEDDPGPAAAGGSPPSSGPNSTRPGPEDEQPGERVAYDAAYALVLNKQFDQALTAFREFLRDYPSGRYTPNAHYWLGELYLVTDPPDLEAARQAFALLVSEYPDSPKAPDALFKLGKVHYMKGNREKAREYLDLVISQYGATNSAAARLARNFIDENY